MMLMMIKCEKGDEPKCFYFPTSTDVELLESDLFLNGTVKVFLLCAHDTDIC